MMAPEDGRTTASVALSLGTQRFDPSKAGYSGPFPTVTVARIAPAPSSLKTFCAVLSVTHTLDPSKTIPVGPANPAVTVVTLHGMVAPGVTIEIEWSMALAVQNFAPSKAMPTG